MPTEDDMDTARRNELATRTGERVPCFDLRTQTIFVSAGDVPGSPEGARRVAADVFQKIKNDPRFIQFDDATLEHVRQRIEVSVLKAWAASFVKGEARRLVRSAFPKLRLAMKELEGKKRGGNG